MTGEVKQDVLSVLQIEVTKRAQKCLFYCPGKVNEELHVEVDAKEGFVLVGLLCGLSLLNPGLFKVSKAAEEQEISLGKGKRLVGLVA